MIRQSIRCSAPSSMLNRGREKEMYITVLGSHQDLNLRNLHQDVNFELESAHLWNPSAA